MLQVGFLTLNHFTDELLKKHSAAGKRVLIFSPSTKSLDLIENYVKANGYTSLRMDGSVQQSKRQALIDEYQTNPNIFIFLLSTRATGVGINLTVSRETRLLNNFSPFRS